MPDGPDSCRATAPFARRAWRGVCPGRRHGVDSKYRPFDNGPVVQVVARNKCGKIVSADKMGQ